MDSETIANAIISDNYSRAINTYLSQKDPIS